MGMGGDGGACSGAAPSPKSPPEYPDLYGKRREMAKVQLLEREISFLQEELKWMEELPPASRSCQEVAVFATENADPLMPVAKKINGSPRFWEWLCTGLSALWICGCCCTSRLETPRCSKSCRFSSCCSCWNKPWFSTSVWSRKCKLSLSCCCSERECCKNRKCLRASSCFRSCCCSCNFCC